MDATESIRRKALRMYAPNASPSVESFARILTRRALETYDPSKAKMQTYLLNQLQPLRREAVSYDTLHTPENVRFDLTEVQKKTREWMEMNGYEPSDGQLADWLKISKKRLEHIRRYKRPVLWETRLRPKSEEETESMPTVAVMSDMKKEYVYAGLGEMDRRIYDFRTGRGGGFNPLSISEIAKKLNLTPSAVSQRLARIDKEIKDLEELE